MWSGTAHGITRIAPLAVLFAAIPAPAQSRQVVVCLVQAADESAAPAQQGGMDARNLALYLRGRTLPNGTPIAPLVLIHLRRSEVDRITEQRGCPYIAELVRHESVDAQSLPGIAAEPGAPGLGPVDAPSIGDRDAILFTLRQAGSRRTLGRFAAPPLARRGRTLAVLFDPYPLFVKEILKKIPATETGSPMDPAGAASPQPSVSPEPPRIAAPQGYSRVTGVWTVFEDGRYGGQFLVRQTKGSKLIARKILETGLDRPLSLTGELGPAGSIEFRGYPGCPCAGRLSPDGHTIRWPGTLLWSR